MLRRLGALVSLVLVTLGSQSPTVAQQAELAGQLRKLDANVFTQAAARDAKLGSMVERDIRFRIHAAIQREAEAFAKLASTEDWEKFRDPRLKALRESLGPTPAVGGEIRVHYAGKFKGDGYVRENVVFESRPGVVVTANVYQPSPPREKMPGILILHGFHQPKQQGELQDMGVNWAKLGCVVLVPDILGHGERRQHPFVDAKSYAGKSSPVRQDYYGRANTGVQLSLIGESLMGWMAFDTFRCVDFLNKLSVDQDRIIVLGAVAAGGDVAATAAALDPRVSAVVPFNFGGPEPETVHPLPAKDAELTFPYAIGGHWDATRRLRNSARDGFLPWVVVGAAGPRRVIYSHEFAWDRAHDPVYPRLEKIFGFYRAGDKLGFANGSGTLFGKPEGTGCANIGPVHRTVLYPILTQWFEIPTPKKEVQDRRPDKDLLCLTPEIVKDVKPRPVHELVAELGKDRMAAAHGRLAESKLGERRESLRRTWGRLLGDVEPKADPKATAGTAGKLGPIAVERLTLEVEPGIVVPLVLLVPAAKAGQQAPLVIGVSEHGKQEFLRQRADAIAELLQAGIAVCLPDVRGTGETRPEHDLRGPPAGTYKGVAATSSGTLLANENLMLGRTLLGDRLRDLRSVIRYLKTRQDTDARRLALWGDSFAPVNAASERIDVPWDAVKLPAQSEPLGGLLALFGALWEEDVRAVQINGCLTGYASLLESPFCHVPHDVIVPGAVAAGDLVEVVAALAPRGVCIQQPVDGHNRRAILASVKKTMEPALQVYRAENAPESLLILDDKKGGYFRLQKELGK